MAHLGKLLILSLILSILTYPCWASQEINGNCTVNGNCTINGTLYLTNSTAPTNSTAAGSKGELRWDGSYLYIYDGSTWERVQLNTW